MLTFSQQGNMLRQVMLWVVQSLENSCECHPLLLETHNVRIADLTWHKLRDMSLNVLCQ